MSAYMQYYSAWISSCIIYRLKEVAVNSRFIERTHWTFEPFVKVKGKWEKERPIFTSSSDSLSLFFPNGGDRESNISSTLKFNKPFFLTLGWQMPCMTGKLWNWMSGFLNKLGQILLLLDLLKIDWWLSGLKLVLSLRSKLSAQVFRF